MEEITQTPVAQDVEGVQETPAESKPQETSVPKVDTNATQSTPAPTRPNNGSAFYARRERERRLERTVKELQEKFQGISAAPKTVEQPQVRTIDPKALTEKLLENPGQFILDLRAEIKKEILEEFEKNQVPKVLKTFEEGSKKATEQSRLKLEEDQALNLLFPAAKGQESITVTDRMNSNPDRAKKLIKIIDDNGLRPSLAKNPEKAARAILQIYDLQYGAKATDRNNPAAPTKAQMAGVGSGTGSANGESKKMTYQELKKQLDDLDATAPSSYRDRVDSGFMEKRKAIVDQMVALYNTDKNKS